ncbi:DnaT-like ssDNA-binding protein [Pseudomonas typographi]|uniref:DnaT-like ssDNA-binding protein n=1 Tax=Pseudomonas typographi TaxID=2715964 RepID=UPI00168561C1|nr:hypothetical protein [Pseudomonas typographi]
MALIIEDGSVVPGAESYATAAELATYSTNFGKTIPADEAAQESLLRRASLQMEAIPWKGCTVRYDQPLAWPRAEVYKNGFELLSNRIPPQVKAGQMALAAEIYADDLVDPATKQGAAIRKKVGPLEFEYAAANSNVTKAAAVRQSYAQFAGLVQSSGQIKLSRS